jgi:hypothetical protein
VLAEVHALQRVGGDVDLDDVPIVVRDREVEVREEVVARTIRVRGRDRGRVRGRGRGRGRVSVRANPNLRPSPNPNPNLLSNSRSKLTDLVSSSPT